MHFAAILWAFIALIPISLSDETRPEPLVIPASEYFEGNDGPWSTFDVRVGTPEQYLRVLVSTASPQTFVVLSEYGCSEDVFSTVPSDCAVSRGNLFNPNDSSTWDAAGTYGINQNGVGLGANLGYEQIAEFGLEDLAVGLTGPGFGNQTIAGIATAEPFYLGMFGLNSQPVNFTTLGNQSSPSFLTTLKDDKKIPSLSWSYTAGARYRLKRVNGQLIFSGYDTSRFNENSVSFTMADDLTRDLVVSLQSITYSGSSSSTLLSEPIDIYIDSTDPNIWLPEDVCDAFEEAFGLTLDQETNLYLINDTYHEELLDSNAEVSFRLSDVESGGDTVSIKLPYSAFGLTAEYPLVEESSHYFPLKRANSSAQYTLGRVFLQEAYLSADYERKVFNVSACVWDEGAEENIVTISSKDDESDGGSSSTSGHSTLNGGQIAGIVVGSVVGAILVVALITIMILRNRRKWLRKGFRIAAPKPEPDDSVLNGPAVFSSETRSSAQDGSVPMSAADVSAPRSTTADGSSSGASPALPSIITGNSTDTPELEGKGIHTLNPDTGLEGKSLGVQRQKTKVASRHVHELPGSDVKGPTTRERNQALRNSAVPPEIDEEEGSDSPPSPLVSTLGTAGQVEQAGTDHIVSPNSPSRPMW